MKTIVVYIDFHLPVHHPRSVSRQHLYAWLHCYRQSKTGFPYAIATDLHTFVPDFWDGEVYRCNTTNFNHLHMLQKVGRIKSQIYSMAGKSLVFDLDAFCLQNISELDLIDAPIAMVPDIQEGIWNSDWPEVGRKHNAGVMLVNSDRVLIRFLQLWESKNSFSHLTFYDECIFSQILHEFNGVQLPRCYNSPDLTDAKIVHFYSEKRKSNLREFIQWKSQICFV